MSCSAIQTGNHFLGAVLSHVDCQAQAIGAYGYGALADPGSPIAVLLLAALTLFIALFGFRLMFGEAPAGRDLVGDVIKVGIVLTLATSWPAWRAVAYDTVLSAPTQLAGTIGGASSLPGSRNDLTQRLDNADQGIVAFTAFGTGRLTGGVVGSTDLGDSTRGIALADQSGFGWGRVAFLAGTIGPLAVVKLTAGILLALAPLMAALLLFAGTRDIFFGWLRALGACALGAVSLALVYSVELAMLESWLRDALGQREAGVLTPAAPTELLVLALAFAAIAWGALGLVVRVMFFATPGWQRLAARFADASPLGAKSTFAAEPVLAGVLSEPARVQRVVDAVAQTMRREERLSERSRQLGSEAPAATATSHGANSAAPAQSEALGSSYRRTHRRSSAAATKRDIAP